MVRGRVGPFVAWTAVVAALAVGVAAGRSARAQGIDRGPGYATSTWATLHGDSSNSDSVPLVTSTDLVREWRALRGAGIVVAPVVDTDGTLFVTTGRGQGTSHLHALTPSGGILWESAPQRGPGDLDSGAVLSAPVLGDDGDVYVGDSNQFFAFHPDGRRKWVAELAAYDARGPFVTGMILGTRVGGITVHGQVLLFDRDTGALAAPVLELPGGASPEGPVPEFVWQEGLIDRAIRRQVLEVLLGYRYEVTNTPAVHPATQRIYLMAAGRTLEDGAFYGIDLVEDTEAFGGVRLEIAFETRTAPATGTSPAISPDGTRVYAFGGSGEIFAIDAFTGELLFERPVDGRQASPTVGADGSVYILAASTLAKLDGGIGDVVWERGYDDFAAEQLPEVGGWRLFVSIGARVARVDSVITVSPNAVWAVLLCGYEVRAGGHDLIHAVRAWLVAVDPDMGSIQAAYPIPDSSEGAISVGRGGRIFLDLLGLQASLAAAAPYERWLPREMRTERPRGGLVAFAPRSKTAHVALGLGWAGDLLARGPVHGPSDRLRAVRAQLEDARWLGVGYAVSAARAAEVGRTLDGVLETIDRCEAGERGASGCGALAGWSRELRLLRSVLQRDAAEAAPPVSPVSAAPRPPAT
jgi:outer membrane protein assembly factor BamB